MGDDPILISPNPDGDGEGGTPELISPNPDGDGEATAAPMAMKAIADMEKPP